MSQQVSESDRAAVEAIAAGLVDAWHHASGAEYASHFAEDADFVNVYGLHGKGRPAIAEGHDHIFKGVYAGSTIELSVTQVRPLAADVLLAHCRGRMTIP